MPTELVPDDSAAAELAAHTRLGLAILAVALCSALLLVVATWLGDVPGSAGGPHPLLAGVVFAGLLAAIMSTADAFLNIGAAAVVHDLPKWWRGKPLENEVRSARIAIVLIAIFGAVFALYSHYVNARLIAFLGVFGSATFAAALVPVVALGFSWRRATARAANLAIAASLVINVGMEVLGIRLPLGIHGGIVAILTSLTLFFGVSLLEPAPKLPADVEAAFDA